MIKFQKNNFYAYLDIECKEKKIKNCFFYMDIFVRCLKNFTDYPFRLEGLDNFPFKL